MIGGPLLFWEQKEEAVLDELRERAPILAGDDPLGRLPMGGKMDGQICQWVATRATGLSRLFWVDSRRFGGQ